MKKLVSLLTSITLCFGAMSGLSANAVDEFVLYDAQEYTSACFYDDIYCNPVDYSLWDRFIKYDLRITDYEALTDEEKELCKFIFETERSANQTVRCERARRILAGDSVGERITIEQLDGASSIFDSEYKKLACSNVIECVPDIMHLDSEIVTDEYWLDDSGDKRVLFSSLNNNFAYVELIDEVTDENREKWYVSNMVEDGRDVYSESYKRAKPIPIGEIETEEGTYINLYDGTVALDGSYAETLVIPETVNGYSVTGVSGFRESDIVDIQLPETLKFIAEEAFFQCSKLESIEINCPEAVIGKFAFAGSAIQTADITAEIIDENAFLNCKELNSVSLNEGVESIEAYAFYDCGSLAEIEIPSTVKTIGQGAFLYTAINSITIPETVEIIGTYPDRYGSCMTSIEGEIPSNDPLTEEPVCAFNPDCVINGWYNTEAHRYALEWGLKFNPMDEGVSYGDINLDGSINIADAVLLQSELMGRDVTVGYEADLAKDGVIDIFDMLEMREKLVTQN